jgi:O-antigen ligase
MNTAFLALLFCSILAVWAESRWPWAIFEIGVFALAAIRLTRASQRKVELALALLVAAAAWPALQVMMGWTISAARTTEAALEWLAFAATYALARDLWDDSGVRRRVLYALSLFGALMAAEAVLQQSTSRGLVFWIFPTGYTEGVLGPFVNRNQFAAWLELLFPISVYLALTDRRLRLLHLTGAAILAGAMVAGASRAGLILLFVETALIAAAAAAQRLAGRRTLAVVLLQLLLLIVAAGAAAGWRPLAERLGHPSDELTRRQAYSASFDMVRHRPWTGYGLGTWAMVYPRFASSDSGLFVNQAHNDWLQWAAEGGMPFLFILAAFALLSCRPAFRSIYGSGIVALLLHALVDYPMQQRPALAAWFFAVCGAAMASRKGGARDDGLLRRTGSKPHCVD